MSSTSSLPTLSPVNTNTSPQLKGLKKVLSSRRRSSVGQNDKPSFDPTPLESPFTTQSAHSSPSRDGSTKLGGSGLRKLIPGHEKRQKQRDRDSQGFMEETGQSRGRDPDAVSYHPTAAIHNNKSTSSLLTDSSEGEVRPSFVSRDSHTGYLTTSSPLMKVVSDRRDVPRYDGSSYKSPSIEEFPIIVEPESLLEPESSPKSMPKVESSPFLPAPGLIDKADIPRLSEPDDVRKSFSRLRGKSPARKIINVFSKPGKSPRTSPERTPTSSSFAANSISTINDTRTLAECRDQDITPRRKPVPLQTGPEVNGSWRGTDQSLSQLDTAANPPRTPPSAVLGTPLTTVTPPTPTDRTHDATPVREQAPAGSDSDSSVVVSSSGNMISHRRVRSDSSTGHVKSKLSTSTTTPLTPTLEEPKSAGEKQVGSRSVTPASSFFSNWVSAAQSAATTLTNLTVQSRGRSDTLGSDAVKLQLSNDPLPPLKESSEQEANGEKKLAVETLGTGNLDFSHFNLETADERKADSPAKARKPAAKNASDLQLDEVQAKFEDTMAKRAVSAAYEKPSEASHVPEVQDPIAGIRQTLTMDSLQTGGTLTPPNGSIFEGEAGGVKRSNSVRSKLANRRSRGSSIATGPTTIGAMISASTSTLVNPTSAPKMTGFNPAPKARNRGYHQQFRSVPEDDNLIEDYSCALQREILLAGRIYISEGHICFSSNILGWVTTLIISFEEIVSIERENTAMIIPNAIAIQTLHARHTFRSLLSREATFDLMIGIWKVNHPASFQKSVNGKQLVAQEAEKQAANAIGTGEDGPEDSDTDSDEDSGSNESDADQDGSAASAVNSSPSFEGVEFSDAKTGTRKPSGPNGAPAPLAIAGTHAVPADVAATAAVIAGVPTVVDFPGPTSHAPTDCADGATHYDKIIKDEVVPAPLGKVYSLLFGPQSGVFVRKYLVDECKCLDLALEDDRKGLSNENKSRQYSYIKPLGGSIGPKQTKCITVEALDFFDLERSVSVTCTTSTPDVPSGGSFSTKTRYCLSWAPGNATRFQMNCTIEWTAKSWLKGPIEKGANDGQQQYGDGLIKALKTALGRSRATTVGSKGAKSKKKKRGEKKATDGKAEEKRGHDSSWGLFQPVQPFLEPVVKLAGPLARIETLVAILAIMVVFMWFTGRTKQGVPGRFGSSMNHAQRQMMYEELWQQQESELWDWLSDRTGINQVMLGKPPAGHIDSEALRKKQARFRKSQLTSKDIYVKMRAEKWKEQELQNAVQVCQDRLDTIQQTMQRGKA